MWCSVTKYTNNIPFDKLIISLQTVKKISPFMKSTDPTSREQELFTGN